MTSQFSDMTSLLNFFDVVLFLLSSLDTGPSFISILSLVQGLWQFLFIMDWPEIRKSKIPPSEFGPISGDWGEKRIPNSAQTSARVASFTVSELLRKNLQGGVKLSPPPRLGLRLVSNVWHTDHTSNAGWANTALEKHSLLLGFYNWYSEHVRYAHFIRCHKFFYTFFIQLVGITGFSLIQFFPFIQRNTFLGAAW